MSWQALIGLSIAITIAACLLRFAVWIAWPRKIEFDPLSDAHGDWPHDGRKG